MMLVLILLAADADFSLYARCGRKCGTVVRWAVNGSAKASSISLWEKTPSLQIFEASDCVLL